MSAFAKILNKTFVPKFTSNVALSKMRNCSSRAFSTVMDQTIHITFVDGEGNRATVPARIGKSLLEVAKLHRVDMEGDCYGGGGAKETRRTENWVEPTYGEGPQCFQCHVQIPSSFNHLLNEQFEDEIFGIQCAWGDEYNKQSRLACLITLERKHDGLVVFVPDAMPYNIA